MATTTTATTEPVALSLTDAAAQVGMSAYQLSDHCRRGTIRARKIGSRWSIAPTDLRDWYESLPTNQDDEAAR